MSSLAEGMENVVRDIQAATEQRKANLSKLRSDSFNLVENFGFGRRDMALSLKDKLNSGAKARLGEARDQLNQRDGEIEQIRANVSELRSDSYNLIERFGLEHRDMARALKDKLNSDEDARLEVAQHETEQRKAKVNAGIEKVNKQRSELAADFRKARSIWSEVKKNFPEQK